ncbi:MAG: rhomboid family intramembrane serine protease, partial [Fimbriimonadia bacterium]|nr:rhomboid family intramembrane serine protease [Fimbriimonadia bacterium]
MLFPLKDHNPSRTFPVITVGLIAINTAIFLLQTANPAITVQYAMIPAEITGSQQAVLEAIRAAGPFALQRMDPQVLQRLFETGPAVPVHMTPFSSMFLHGSWLHLLANMWSLWIFGNNVEDALGKLRYLLIYLIW